MKLTKPQMALLIDVANGGDAHDGYPPARKLVDLGLCYRQKIGFSEMLKLTDAGRDALAKESGE